MKIKDIYETMEYSPAPESPDLALEWLKEHKSKFGLFINGKWCKAKSGKVFSTDNPASGKKLASISEAGKSDVDSAVSAAKIVHFQSGKPSPDMSVPAIYMLSPDSCKNTHGYLQSLKLWITEKRFAKPVTSTFLS